MHGNDEFVNIDELILSAQIFAEVIVNLCSSFTEIHLRRISLQTHRATHVRPKTGLPQAGLMREEWVKRPRRTASLVSGFLSGHLGSAEISGRVQRQSLWSIKVKLSEAGRNL